MSPDVDCPACRQFTGFQCLRCTRWKKGCKARSVCSGAAVCCDSVFDCGDCSETKTEDPSNSGKKKKNPPENEIGISEKAPTLKNNYFIKKKKKKSRY
ncbi:hypothetical protein CEXT_721901 [Caerostris extrusa]|uniref:Uncharacterized protein n=1 Tax=Caerostris extrusa TaxID=172846 RepID=A0AAV4R330_CAEEX|nr:hypothetical protein CEXT_721901 [Caerostris extrusa]